MKNRFNGSLTNIKKTFVHKNTIEQSMYVLEYIFIKVF